MGRGVVNVDSGGIRGPQCTPQLPLPPPWQNRGIYMFRINNEHVIDATLTGGPAR